MHISKIIDYVKNEINFSQEFCEDNVFVTLRTEAILRLIENLEQSHKDILEITKENEEKDKQIDLILKEQIEDGYLVNFHNLKEAREYYRKLVKEKEGLKDE